MKLIVDSSYWISLLINGKYADFLINAFNKKIEIYSSVEQLEELTDVLRRERFQKYISDDVIKEFINIFSKTCRFVDLKEEINLCRDAKDNYILEIAVAADADVIITMDEDLLIMHPFRNIHIVHGYEFIKNDMNLKGISEQ